MNSLNANMNDAINELVTRAQDALSGPTNGAVTIKRDQHGNVTVSYRVLHYIPVYKD